MSFNSSSRNVPSCSCPPIRYSLVLPCAGQVNNGWTGKFLAFGPGPVNNGWTRKFLAFGPGQVGGVLEF